MGYSRLCTACLCQSEHFMSITSLITACDCGFMQMHVVVG